MTTPDIAEARRLAAALRHEIKSPPVADQERAGIVLDALADELERLRAQLAPAGWVAPECTPESMTELAVAIGELSQAMGSPCVMARAPQTLKSQTVRMAAFRLKEAEAAAAAPARQAAALDELIASGEEIDNALAQPAHPESVADQGLASENGGCRPTPSLTVGDEPAASVIATAPERIWLNVFDAPENTDGDKLFPSDHEGVTWAEDEVGDYDVQYIRADLAQPAAQAEPVALPHPGSPEASAMIDSVLAEYQWPTNAKNAARAGYVAAMRLLDQPAAQAEPVAFSGASFIQHVQSVADGGHAWADEWLNWYSPGEWLSEERAVAAFLGQKLAEPMDMALCESRSLVLREGQAYRFRRVGECATCAAMSAASREAYGEPPAADADHKLHLSNPPAQGVELTDEQIEQALLRGRALGERFMTAADIRGAREAIRAALAQAQKEQA